MRRDAWKLSWVSILVLAGCLSVAPKVTDDVPASDPGEDATVDTPAQDRAVDSDAAADAEGACTPNDHKACCDNAVCWFDGCGEKGEKVVDCAGGCEAGVCKDRQPQCAG